MGVARIDPHLPTYTGVARLDPHPPTPLVPLTFIRNVLCACLAIARCNDIIVFVTVHDRYCVIASK